MVPHGERESICSMLRDTVKILVKNGLTFKYKFNIDGLLGITVDDGDVFLVPMSELVKSDAESQTLELEVEEVDREEHKYTNIRTPVTHRPGQGARKRQLTNTKSSTKQNDSSDEDISEPLSNQSTAVPVGEAIPSKKVCMNNVNDVTDGLPKDITIKREIDEDSWTQENHSYPDQSDHSTDQSLFLDATYSATSATGVYTPAMLENIPGTSSYEYMDDTSSMSTRQKRRLPPTEYAKLYRHVKRNDPEFRRKNAERSRRYRQNLSDEKRARNRETARIRQQRYLQRLRLREQLSHSLDIIQLKNEPGHHSLDIIQLKSEPEDFDQLKLQPEGLNQQIKRVIQVEPEGVDEHSVQSEHDGLTE